MNVFKYVLAPRVKNYPLGGVWRNQQFPLFTSEPPRISETNRARKLKFGTLADICRYYGYIKNLSARGRLGRSATPTFLVREPLHISVTNGARKLKFGTPVGIYVYYSPV